MTQTKLITPTIATQVTQALQPVQPVKPLLPTQATVPTVPTIERLKAIRYGKQTNAKEVETFLANYNDPTELNSYIDALTNREAVSKEFGDVWGTISTVSGTVAVLSYVAAAISSVIATIAPVTAPVTVPLAAGLSKVGTVAAIPAIPAAVKVTYDYGIKPIIKGKPDEAGLNALMNLGETMDAVANPIKGLFIEGPTGFLKGTGLADSGRQQYDYDTGNLVADIVLEIISDPMNWIEFPTKIALKSATKTAANAIEPITELLIKNANDVLRGIDDIAEIGTEGSEAIKKKMKAKTADIIQRWSTLAEDATDEVKERLRKQSVDELQSVLVKALEKEIPNATGTQLSLILEKAGKDKAWVEFTQKAQTQLAKDVTWDTLATDTIKGLSRTAELTDAFQGFLTKGAFMTSGYGAGVELIKNIGKPIIQWAQSRHIMKLVGATQFFDQVKGLFDLTKFEEAKAFWEYAGKYYNNFLTGATETPIHDLDSFYRLFSGQLDRDQQLFRKALQEHIAEPNAQIAALNAICQELYGIDLTQYMTLLKEISANNGNKFIAQLDYLNNVHESIFLEAATQPVSETVRTSAQLWAKNTISNLVTQPLETIKKLQELQKAKTPDDVIKTLYTLKLNDFATTAALINDPAIYEVLLELNSNTGVGAFLNHIISDINSLAPEVSAAISDNVRILKAAGQNFVNLRDFYDNIAKLTLPKIPGIKTDDLKRYIIDQIFGFTDDVSTLLANFDGTTMRNLMTRLEMFLGEGIDYFKFSDDTYKVLYDQISSAFKTYLRAQQAAGLETIKATIIENFTKSIDDLVKQFPQFADQFKRLQDTSTAIKFSLSAIQKENAYLLSAFFSDSDTIFKAYSARQLSDMGLALRTVATKECLELFEDVSSFSGNMLLEAERMGKRLLHTVKQCKQYSYRFTDELANEVKALYKTVLERFLKNNTDESLTLFKSLADLDPDVFTDGAIHAFARLIELYKIISNNKVLLKEWHNIINPLTADSPMTAEVYRLLINPSVLYKTDFAWDAMAQSAFYAERALNTQIINLIGTYDTLGVFPKKIDKDFYNIRKLLSDTGADKPKILQLERYSRAVKSTVTTLDWFKGKYNSLFDMQLAQQTINDLRKTFLNNPDLYNKYEDLIDTLEKYWNGEIRFEQDPRYLKGTTGFVDEFTPFWERVKEMNRSYVEMQRDVYTEDLLYTQIYEQVLKTAPERYNIPAKDRATSIINKLKAYFAEKPAERDNILRILNEHTALETEADWKVYRDFLDFLNKTGTNVVIVPNALKNNIYDFIEKTYNITDVNLIYHKMDDILFRPKSAAGWVNYGKKANINLRLNSPFFTSKEALMQAINHEALHNIMRTLSASELKELYVYTLKTLQQTLPHSVYSKFLTTLLATYATAYQIPFTVGMDPIKFLQQAPKALQEKVSEEILAHCFANQLPSMAKHVTLLDTEKQMLLGCSQKLQEALQQIAKERIPLTSKSRKKMLKNPYIKNIKSVTPWDPIREQQKVRKAILRASDANGIAGLARVLNFTPEQLQTELAFRKRYITFSDSDLTYNQALAFAYKRLQKTTNPDLGIKFIYDQQNQRHWIVLDKKVRMQGREVYFEDGTHLIRETYKRTFNEFATVDELLGASEETSLVKMFNELGDKLEELTGSNLGDSQGEFLSKEMMKKIYAQMPEEVKAILKEEDILQDEFFQAYAFNESVLGTASSKAKLGVESSDLIITAQNTLTQAQCYVKAKTEYVHTVFDSSFSISGKNSIYANYSDEDLLNALQTDPNYKLVALVYDKKRGVRVEEILPINTKAIQKGRELGAVIVPLQTYKDMYKVVNKRLGSSGFMNIWNKIIYVFKFGYLMRPGAWIRNWIDTNLKTNFELGTEASSYRNQARKVLREMEDIKDFIMARDTEGMLRKDAIIEYFKTHPSSTITPELFDEISNLYKPSGILGNIMSAEGLEEGTDLWGTFTHYTGKIIDTVNKTEEVNRLAILLADLDKGADVTSAMAKLAKTHFDYSFKSTTEQLLEMVFPFTTFTLRNLSYWVEALEKHPWLMRNYVHFMKPSWDFKDYTPEELATNYQIQNQIKYGQLKLAEFGDKIVTFKLNPSIGDAIQMFTDPINNIYEKLAAPLAVPTKALIGEYTNPLDLVPVLGPAIKDIKQGIETGSPIPSIISAIDKPKKRAYVNYTNSNLAKASAYRGTTYHRPVYTKNTIMDSYSTKGVQRYRTRFYPIIDVARDVRNKYSINVYNKIKNQVKTDVYQGIRYSIRLNANRFR